MLLRALCSPPKDPIPVGGLRPGRRPPVDFDAIRAGDEPIPDLDPDGCDCARRAPVDIDQCVC